MTWSRERFLEIIGRHRIAYGITLALVIATLLTTISMALYNSSGASRLDLSRPGYEKVREDIANTAEDTFSSTGPMNTDVANDFLTRFEKHRDTLSKLDTYGTNALDDTELQITPDSN